MRTSGMYWSPKCSVRARTGEVGAPGFIRHFVVEPACRPLVDSLLMRRRADFDNLTRIERNANQVARRCWPASELLTRGDFQIFGPTWLNIVTGLADASVNHKSLLRWYSDSSSEQTGPVASDLMDGLSRTFARSDPRHHDIAREDPGEDSTISAHSVEHQSTHRIIPPVILSDDGGQVQPAHR